MARYKVLEKTFHHIDVKEVGSEIEFDGKPGPNLEYVSGEKYKEPEAELAPKSAAEIALEAAQAEITELKAKLNLTAEDPAAEEEAESDDLT